MYKSPILRIKGDMLIGVSKPTVFLNAVCDSQCLRPGRQREETNNWETFGH